MSLLQVPTKAFFFASFLFRKDLVSEDSIKTMWEKKWGESFYFHHPFFPMKEYYSKEMGDSNLLQRLFGVSLILQNREDFVQGKIWSTEKEIEMSHKEKLGLKARTVNIDLGCLSLENIQLATGKPNLWCSPDHHRSPQNTPDDHRLHRSPQISPHYRKKRVDQ